MNIREWFTSGKQRRRERRQRRFRTAWRTAKDSVVFAAEEGIQSKQKLETRAIELAQSQPFSSVVGSWIIALAIQLIPYLVKLFLSSRSRSGAENNIDSVKFLRLCDEVESQSLQQLKAKDTPLAMAKSVPEGSIPEVIQVLSELFEVLARLWDLLDGDQ